MGSIDKGLLRNSVVFALASVVQKLVQFALVPVIITYVGREALKVYDVALVYATLFAMLCVMGLDVAASVHYFDTKKTRAERARVLSSGLYIQGITTAILLGLLVVLHQPLGRSMFGGDEATARGWTIVLWSVPGTVAINYALNILRWVERSATYLALCALQVAGALLPALYLVLLHGKGLDALLWSHVGGMTLAGVAGLWLVRRELGGQGAWRRPAWSAMRPLISYGLVFGCASFFFGLLPAMDRSFLLRFGLNDTLPEYALAARLGAVPGLVTTAVGLAASTHAFRIWHRTDAAAEVYHLARAILVFFLALVPVSLVAKDWLVELFANAIQYPHTAELLPFFFYGCVADGALYFAMLGLYKSKRAWPPLIVLAASTGIAGLLNIVLIPTLGIAGAALAFTLAKSVQVVFSWIWSSRYWHIRVPVRPLAIALGLSLSLTWCAYRLPLGWYTLMVLLAVGAAGAWIKQTGMLHGLLRPHGPKDASAEEKIAETESASLHHDVL